MFFESPSNVFATFLLTFHPPFLTFICLIILLILSSLLHPLLFCPLAPYLTSSSLHCTSVSLSSVLAVSLSELNQTVEKVLQLCFLRSSLMQVMMKSTTSTNKRLLFSEMSGDKFWTFKTPRRLNQPVLDNAQQLRLKK